MSSSFECEQFFTHEFSYWSFLPESNFSFCFSDQAARWYYDFMVISLAFLLLYIIIAFIISNGLQLLSPLYFVFVQGISYKLCIHLFISNINIYNFLNVAKSIKIPTCSWSESVSATSYLYGCLWVMGFSTVLASFLLYLVSVLHSCQNGSVLV